LLQFVGDELGRGCRRRCCFRRRRCRRRLAHAALLPSTGTKASADGRGQRNGHRRQRRGDRVDGILIMDNANFTNFKNSGKSRLCEFKKWVLQYS